MTTAACRGFVYATAVMGVTGARTSTSDLAGPLVARTRAVTDLPVGVGPGRQQRRQAAEVAAYADGVIVGSAFVRVPARPPTTAASALKALTALTEDLAGACVVRRRSSALPRPAPPWRLVGCAQELGRATFTGAVLAPAVPRAGHGADRHRGQALLARVQHRQAADPGLLRLHPLPRRVPDHDGDPRVGHAPARRRRPRQRPGGLRDHRPRARHRPGAPALPRPASTRRSSGSPGRCRQIKHVAKTLGVAVAKGKTPAQRRLRRHPRHPGPRPRRRRTPCPSSGPSAPPPPEFAHDIHQLLS